MVRLTRLPVAAAVIAALTLSVAVNPASASLAGIDTKACLASDTRASSDCGVTFTIDGQVVGTAGFVVNPETGAISVEGSPTFSDATGSITLNSVGGNIDPFIIFGLGATNTSLLPKTYSAAFSLPISLTGGVDASANVLYTLTSGSDAGALGATLFPTSGIGKVVDSQDIRFSPFSRVDKGVDVGDDFSVGEGVTAASPLYSATNFLSLAGPTPYTLMSVVVAFGLTGDSAAGLSGKVEQIPPIPEPGTLALLFAGFVALAGIARRRMR